MVQWARSPGVRRASDDTSSPLSAMRPSIQHACLLFVTASSIAAAARSQTITPLVLEGDLVGGVGAVTTIDNLTIANGTQWIVEADTDNANTDADGCLIKNGVLFLREGQSLATPVGATLDSFDALTLNANGNSGWNFFLANTGGINDDSGIYFDATLVIQEGTLSTASGFSPNTPYIGFFETKFNASNQILVLASIDDPGIATTVDRALVVVQVNGTGGLISETVLAKEGDFLSGQSVDVADFGTGPHAFDFNASGDVLFIADLNGAAATDGAIYLNNVLLAQEGSPSPVAGRNWLSLSTSQRVALNDNGDTVHTGQLDGSTSDDLVIIKNGALFRQEGQSLPAFAPFLLTGFGSGPLDIDANGNVLWFGDWDDPNTAQDTGLFLNDTLLVQEGVTQINGQTLMSLSGVQDGYAISDDGTTIVFEGQLTGGVQGAFLVDLGCPQPSVYCAALISSSGCLPSMSASGTASLASPAGFTVSGNNIETTQNGLLFFGTTGQNNVPFFGGTLCVAPTLYRLGIKNSGGGASCTGSMSYTLAEFLAEPSGGPLLVAGQVVNCQIWYRDPPAPQTVGLTDGLEFTVCP